MIDQERQERIENANDAERANEKPLSVGNEEMVAREARSEPSEAHSEEARSRGLGK